jgi:hypothetical protein
MMVIIIILIIFAESTVKWLVTEPAQCTNISNEGQYTGHIYNTIQT